MIGLTSPEIESNTSSDELFIFLSNPIDSANIYQCKYIKQFKASENEFNFILKWGAAFFFQLKPSKDSNKIITFESKKEAPFKSKLVFEIIENGKFIIDFESDTTPYMDYIIQKKIDFWLNEMVKNIQAKFK